MVPVSALAGDSIELEDARMTFRMITDIFTSEGRVLYMQETEVTNWQYKKFLDSTGKVKADRALLEKSKEDGGMVEIQKPNGLVSLGFFGCENPALMWSDNKYPEGFESHPVVLVSPADCDEFCMWLNKKYASIGHFRLPTFGEWNLACYGFTQKYPWGDDFNSSFFHNRDNTSGFGQKNVNRIIDRYTCNVTQYPKGKTKDGIFGLWGNVNEFVAGQEQPGKRDLKAMPMSVGGGYKNLANDRIFQPRYGVIGMCEEQHIWYDDKGFRVVCEPKK